MSATIIYSKVTIDAFLAQLDAKERKCYMIAIEQLGSSFSLEESIAFQAWVLRIQSSPSVIPH